MFKILQYKVQQLYYIYVSFKIIGMTHKIKTCSIQQIPDVFNKAQRLLSQTSQILIATRSIEPTTNLDSFRDISTRLLLSVPFLSLQYHVAIMTGQFNIAHTISLDLEKEQASVDAIKEQNPSLLSLNNTQIQILQQQGISLLYDTAYTHQFISAEDLTQRHTLIVEKLNKAIQLSYKKYSDTGMTQDATIAILQGHIAHSKYSQGLYVESEQWLGRMIRHGEEFIMTQSIYNLFRIKTTTYCSNGFEDFLFQYLLKSKKVKLNAH